VQAHEHGKVESPFLGLRTFADPKKHILLQDVTVLDRATFELIAKLSVTVESKPGKGQEFLFLGPFSGPEVIFH
jgi:hypothetical protein